MPINSEKTYLPLNSQKPLSKIKVNYQSHAFEQVCQEYKVDHRFTQFRHPWTNDQVERINRTTK
ncbi:MAG: DDE-type integrase/transposase/recombinase [Alphaproteobacteria bacterium]|nr:DDE-type integrase/transposase/recombinase [Alphaproteobacteria bacterium]MBP9776409.1 DDE-type integrase/transposase/recombinase [Alphaproteobacteria bacterium]